MNKSLFARILAVLAVTALLAFGFSPAANAATLAAPAAGSVSSAITSGEGVGSSGTVCAGSGGGSGASSTSLLPVVRWSDATADMHSRLDNTWMGDTANLVQRHQVVGNGMAAGNFMWSLGTGLSSFAINFCLLSSAGGAADEVGSAIGKIMLDSPLMAFLIVFAIVALFWQGHRRGNMPWKTLMVKAILVGVFAAMVGGSMASTGGGKGGDNSPYNPGLMSPGWIVTTMNNTVSSLASAPAAALAGHQATQLDTGDTSTSINGGNILSCENYVKGIHKGYQETYGTGATALASGVPTIMSSLWERTGLQTWRMAQFGPTGLDENTWCRLLEWNSNSRTIGTTMDGDRLASATTVRSIMYRVMGELGLQTIYETPAYTKLDNATADKSLMAWSACRLATGADPTKEASWTISPAFAPGDGGDKDGKAKPDGCMNWYTQDGAGAGDFDWSPNPEEVNKRTANLDLRDYVHTIHGNANAYGLTSVFAYFLSALFMLAVFGLVALAIIVAKIAMVVMIITAFFLMLVAMMPSATLDKLSGFLKMLLGMNLFVFGIQLLFALISIITQMLQNAGDAFLGGPGSLVSIMWAGLSPMIAVGLLHMMFTKVLKVPSPFKLSAGVAWGGAAGGAGGAAFAGMSNLLDRKQGSMTGSAKRAGSRGINQALSAASGGRLGRAAGTTRRGAASPADAATAAAGKDNAALATSAGEAAPAAASKDNAALAGAAGEAAPAAAGAKGGEVVESVEGTGSSKAGPSSERAGTFEAALATAVIPNSKLTSGEMTAAERKVAKSLAGDERAAAKQWEFQRRKDAVIPEEVTGVKVISEELRNSLSNTKQAFKDRPLQTSAKVIAGAALLASTTPALAVLPVVGGAWLAKRAVVNTKRDLLDRKHFNDNVVENYRAAARAHSKAQEEAQAPVDRNSQTGEATETPTDANQSEHRGASHVPLSPDGAEGSQSAPNLPPGEVPETGRRVASAPNQQTAAYNQKDRAGAGLLAPQRPAGQPQQIKPPTRPGEGRPERPAPANSESKGVR